MNWDQVEGNWKQFKGKVKEKWGQLTDDDLSEAAGRRDQILGKLQERYGWQRDHAERELDALTSTWRGSGEDQGAGEIAPAYFPRVRPVPLRRDNWGWANTVLAETGG